MLLKSIAMEYVLILKSMERTISNIILLFFETHRDIGKTKAHKFQLYVLIPNLCSYVFNSKTC
jgi:hypothetical protein